MTTTFPANISREQFTAFRTTFRALANAKALTSTDILINNLIRGLPADRGFHPISNATKLANGADEWFGFNLAKSDFRWSNSFKKTATADRYKSLTAENITELLKLM